MGILAFLIPLAVLMSALGAWAYVWACKSGQLDDLESPAYKILIDDKKSEEKLHEH